MIFKLISTNYVYPKYFFALKEIIKFSQSKLLKIICLSAICLLFSLGVYQQASLSHTFDNTSNSLTFWDNNGKKPNQNTLAFSPMTHEEEVNNKLNFVANKLVACTPVPTSNWMTSGNTVLSTAGTTDVSFSVVDKENTSISYTPNEAFSATNFWSNTSLTNQTSLGFHYIWDTSKECIIEAASDDADSIIVSITFSEMQSDPIIHIDRLGGNGNLTGNNYFSNSSQWTLITPDITLTKLSGNTQLMVDGNQFYRVPDVDLGMTNPSSEADNTTGTAAGSIQFNGEFSTLTFLVTGIGIEGGGGDELEFIFETCSNDSVTPDTDADNVGNTIDLDDDNDGILDAVENPCNTMPSESWASTVDTARGMAGTTDIAVSITNTVNTAITYSPNGTFNSTNFWSNSSLVNQTSLELQYIWDTTNECILEAASDDGDTATISITFQKCNITLVSI